MSSWSNFYQGLLFCSNLDWLPLCLVRRCCPESPFHLLRCNSPPALCPRPAWILFSPSFSWSTVPDRFPRQDFGGKCVKPYMVKNAFNLLSHFNQSFRSVKRTLSWKTSSLRILMVALHCLLASTVEKSDTVLITGPLDILKCHNDVSSRNLRVAWEPWVTSFKTDILSTLKTVLQF